MDPNKAKLLFFTFLEAASRYREGYWREELEAYSHDMRETAAVELSKADRGKRRKIERYIEESITLKKLELERFNRAMYNLLDNQKMLYSDQANMTFDNYATAFALMAEELEKADNSKHLLTVCRLYNEGYFEHVRERIIEGSQKLNNKYENEKSNNTPVNGADTERDQLPEKEKSEARSGIH